MIEYIIQSGALGLCAILCFLLFKMFNTMQKNQCDTQIAHAKEMLVFQSVLQDLTTQVANNTKAFDRLYDIIKFKGN